MLFWALLQPRLPKSTCPSLYVNIVEWFGECKRISIDEQLTFMRNSDNYSNFKHLILAYLDIFIFFIFQDYFWTS